MERLSLPDAFARYGARATSQSRALSAIAEDGAVVLNCSLGHFGRPARGVLRYEDRLSREPGDSEGKGLLGEHLARARDESLPVRMVVRSETEERNGRLSRNFHVRTDLVGKVTMFDGDHFIVDFTRRSPQAALGRGKQSAR